MAKEIRVEFATGNSLYALFFNTVGRVWDGSAFVTMANSITTYAQAMSESLLLTEYTLDFPALSAGLYSCEVRKRVGGSAATTDPVIAGGDFNWSGTAIVPLTGDPFARLGVGGAGLTSIPTIAHVTLVDTVTNASGGLSFPTATVSATPTPTNTTFAVTGLSIIVANAYKDAYAVFTASPTLAFSTGFPVIASSYDSGTLKTTLHFTGLPAVPASGDTLLLLGSKK